MAALDDAVVQNDAVVYVDAVESARIKVPPKQVLRHKSLELTEFVLSHIWSVTPELYMSPALSLENCIKQPADYMERLKFLCNGQLERKDKFGIRTNQGKSTILIFSFFPLFVLIIQFFIKK